ncbi:MAG TPA: hypothetical protein ENH82_05090 [bacterium]|nr:hypothetical protein [bacterium]
MAKNKDKKDNGNNDADSKTETVVVKKNPMEAKTVRVADIPKFNKQAKEAQEKAAKETAKNAAKSTKK